MAGRIVYLEIDDEITSAAARIRGSDASRIAVVLPYGSRVATSRINFRLLSRDALTHDKRLSIVSGDPATRALAASAGLPVFASVARVRVVAGRAPTTTSAARDDRAGRGRHGRGRGAGRRARRSRDPSRRSGRPRRPAPPAETRLGRDARARRPGRGRRRRDARRSPGETIRSSVPWTRMCPATRAPPPDVPAGGGAPRPLAALTDRFGGSGGVRTPWLIGGAILALAVLVAGVGAYLLPALGDDRGHAARGAVGPIQMTVVADTDATAARPGERASSRPRRSRSRSRSTTRSTRPASGST